MSATRDAALATPNNDGTYQKISGPSASTPLTVPAGAKYALIKTEAQSIRWKAHRNGAGTIQDPTTTDGMLIDVGDEFWFTGPMDKFRMIQTAATAVVHVHYFS